MKIAQLVTNMHRVDRLSNRAISSHVAHVSNGLVAAGHEVHLFCAEGSQSDATLHPATGPLSKLDLPDDIKRYYIYQNISNCYQFARENVDIIHSHFNLLSSFFQGLVDVPTLTSLHSPVTERIRPLLQHYKNNKYISFSHAQRKQIPELNWYATIYHGVDTELFAYEPKPEEYLLYLGRITEEKGVHFAIQAAMAVGLPLKIAGASYVSEGYWQNHIEPYINGTSVQYIGEVSFENKIPLLQKAKALLFPTLYDEVFGYVMIEAMSCGTPVIGFDNGSVSEIIQDGKTGFVVRDAEGMIEAIKNIDRIDRKDVRNRARGFFSKEKMILGYEKVFQRLLNEQEHKKKSRQ